LFAGAVVVAALLAGLRVLAGRAFGGRGRVPRVRVRGARGGGLLLVPWLAVRGVARLAGGLVVWVARGGTPPEAGATWWRSASAVARRPSLDPLAGKPGVVRVLAYLVLPVALAVGLTWWTMLTALAAAVALVAGAAGWAGRREARGRAERNEAAFLALASYLDVDPAGADWRDWLAVPRHVRGPDAVITVRLPRHWTGTDRQREGIASVIGQRFPGAWEPAWRSAELTVTFARPPQPPAVVPFADDGGPVHRFPFGVDMRGRPDHIDFEQETPNVLISASPGWGKTLFIALAVAWFVSRGATAIILDGKRTSYLKGPRKIPPSERGFSGVPGITIHADLPAMMAALTEIRQEMDRRYQLRAQGADIDDEAEFPTILLAIDEISRFTTEVRMWWRSLKGKGDPPCFADYLAILWQGREARIYVVVGVHNPNARVLVNSDARSMFATRVAAGPQDPGGWRMLFGSRPMPAFSTRKGRAWVAVGVDATERQLYHSDLQTSRQLALTHTGPGQRPDVPAYVPPAPPPPPPGQTPLDVPDTGTVPDGVARRRLTWPPAPGQGPAWPLPPATPGPPSPDPGPAPDSRPDVGQDQDVIVGLEAAARALGTTYEAFRKTRQRNGPIPGEQRVGGSPAWSAGELRGWYAKLPRAGRHLPPPDGQVPLSGILPAVYDRCFPWPPFSGDGEFRVLYPPKGLSHETGRVGGC
jgi:hypothetical protein